jgi:PAS domain S-box-containing protein
MKDKNKTKEELIDELVTSRRRISELKNSINELDRIKKSLQKNEEELEAIFNGANSGIAVLDKTGKIIRINRRVKEVGGYREKEIIGKRFSLLKMFPPRSITKMLSVFNKLRKGQDVPPYEMELYTRKGEKIIVEVRNSILRKKGRFEGVIAILTDITKQRQAEAEVLKQSKYNELRAEIWKKSADPSLTEEKDLIQELLNTVGPFIDVSRATYLPFNPERKAFVTELQWYKKKAGSSLGEDISLDLAKNFFGRECVEIPKDIDKIKKTLVPSKAIKLYASTKLKRHKIKSYLVVPYGDIDRPKGIFTFSECKKERKWTELEKRILSEVVNIVSMKTEQIKAEQLIKTSLKEKEVLLREIHHRVKNNLQVISSLLNLQAQYLKNKQDLAMFNESKDRVRSMALIHEKLYQSQNLARIDFAGYIRDLIYRLFRSYEADSGKIDLKMDVKDVSLGVDIAVPCGLIVNELISNCLKHAFPDGKKGEIRVGLQSINMNEVELKVSDNGVGLPDDFDFRESKSLGMQLVNILAEDQLGGMIELNRTEGTEFKIKFKRTR